jgi:hypothetical protein
MSCFGGGEPPGTPESRTVKKIAPQPGECSEKCAEFNGRGARGIPDLEKYCRGSTRPAGKRGGLCVFRHKEIARVATPAACARRRAGRDAWRRWLVHRSVAVLPTASTLPVGDSTDFGKGYSQLEFPRSLCSTCSCAPRVFRRASQGPQGRVVPFGGARQGPDPRLRTAVQQRRPGRVPRFIGAYSSSPVHRAFVSGCEGPSIAELRSVACRVAS